MFCESVHDESAGKADGQHDERQHHGGDVGAVLHLSLRALSWKKMDSGSVAAGCVSEVGTESENPAVNMTPAASPMARPTESSVAVAMPGVICRSSTQAVSKRVAP